MSVPKVVRDGKVAVIVSPGYGAGWSTWSDKPEAAVFAPDVAAWIEAGKKNSAQAIKKFTEKYGYAGGLRDAEIRWVEVGDRFAIEEYDGNESLIIYGPDWGYTA